MNILLRGNYVMCLIILFFKSSFLLNAIDAIFFYLLLMKYTTYIFGCLFSNCLTTEILFASKVCLRLKNKFKRCLKLNLIFK